MAALLLARIQSEIDNDTQRYRLSRVLRARGIDAAPDLLVLPQFEALPIDLSVAEESFTSPSRDRIERAVEAGFTNLILDPLYDLIGDADISDRNMQVPGILRWLTSLQAKGCTVWATTLGDPSKGRAGIFGSKFLRHWLEGALFTRRSNVPGHPEWSDFTVTRDARRHHHPDLRINLRGTDVGVFE